MRFWVQSELNVFWLLMFSLFELYKILAFLFLVEDFTNFMTDCLDDSQDPAIEKTDI